MEPRFRNRWKGILVLALAIALCGGLAAAAPKDAGSRIERPQGVRQEVLRPVTAERGAVQPPWRLPDGLESVPGGTPEPEKKPPAALPSSPEAGSEAGPPMRERAWNVLMTETFEGIFPGLLWAAFDGSGATNGEYYWDDDDFKPHTSYWSAWAANGGANGLNPEYYNYPDNMDAWMVYGPFDLSGCASADYDFYYWNKSESGHDELQWHASRDGVNFYGLGVSGDSGGWQYVDMDLASYLGDSSVWLAFKFVSDSSVTDVGAFVDDVALWCFRNTTVKPWTYLVYLDGDNNLEDAAIGDFLELASVGTSANVSIVVQMDRTPGYNSAYDDWTDTRRFVVSSGMQPLEANGVSIGEANMGDPETLVNFVRWGKAAAPANHYALVLWDHGNGWRFTELAGAAKAVAIDDSSGGDAIDMTELRAALGTVTNGGASPIDLLGMDACQMAMIEVDDQIRPYAGVRVGSEESEPNDGWPHDTILAVLAANPALTATELATNIVDHYYASYGNNYTQSAVALGSPYDTLTASASAFAEELIEHGANWVAELQAARNASTQFSDADFSDLGDFADLVRGSVAEDDIYEAAMDVRSAIAAAVLHEHHGAAWPGARGVSVYFPKTASTYDGRYDGGTGFLQFTVQTQWDEWLHAYHAFASYPAMFEKTGPANGATGQELALSLSWSASAGATEYQYCCSMEDDDDCEGSWVSTGNATSASVSGLAAGTTYYWQVRARNASGAVEADKGAWWSLTTGYVPGAFAKAGPANGAVNEPLGPTLSWTASPGASSYAYCYDTSNDNACAAWTSNGGANSVQLSALDAGTTYYWQVRALNGIGTTYANGSSTAFWSFTIGAIPGAFVKASPSDASGALPASVTLSWGTSSGVGGYQYCFDTVDNEACDASWVDVGAATAAGLGGLAPGTTFFWQVRAVNDFGMRFADAGSWWSFTTGVLPGAFSKSAPADGAMNQWTSLTLSWVPSADAAAYEYCWDLADNGSCDTSWVNVGTSLGAEIGNLASTATYYWQVRAVTSYGETEANGGSWWSFTIADVRTATFISVGAMDGWVLESLETSNAGGSMNAAATTFNLGDDARDRQYRAVMHFRTSRLPDVAIVMEASVSIKKQGLTGANPFATHQSIVIDLRRGVFSGSAALQLRDFQAAACKPGACAITSAAAAGGWYSAKLPAAALPFINKVGATQVRLRFRREDDNDARADYCRFYSGNAAARSYRPRLVVKYFVP